MTIFLFTNPKRSNPFQGNPPITENPETLYLQTHLWKDNGNFSIERIRDLPIQEAYQHLKTQPNVFITMEVPNPITKKYSVNFSWADAEIIELNTVKREKRRGNIPESRKIMGNLAEYVLQLRIKKKKERVGNWDWW